MYEKGPLHVHQRRGFCGNVVFAVALLGGVLVTLSVLAGLLEPINTFGVQEGHGHMEGMDDDHHSDGMSAPPPGPLDRLNEIALGKVLDDAAPIFGRWHGPYEHAEEEWLTRWMHDYPDETPLAYLNLPGVHDAATWNYTAETQKSLKHITDLLNLPQPPHTYLQCNELPLLAMLNAGVRVFDLRFAWDVTSTSITFWHGRGLQSQTATLESVLFAFYAWLATHDSEIVLISLQYEGDTATKHMDSYDLQAELHRTLTSVASRTHVSQIRGRAGTLGENRGKVVLLKRFDLDLLPEEVESQVPGLHFPPRAWPDNGKNFKVVLDEESEAVAFVQDYYHPSTSASSSAADNIQSKWDALEAGLARAAERSPDVDGDGDKHDQETWYWHFASSTQTRAKPPCTPRIQALGNGTDITPDGGVNQKLAHLLEGLEGKRLGIVMLDFFNEPKDLVKNFIKLRPPPGHADEHDEDEDEEGEGHEHGHGEGEDEGEGHGHGEDEDEEEGHEHAEDEDMEEEHSHDD